MKNNDNYSILLSVSVDSSRNFNTLYYFILLFLTFSCSISLIATITQKGAINMRPLKEKISITVDTDIVTKIKELAEADDRSFSQYINMVLKEHISKTENNQND